MTTATKKPNIRTLAQQGTQWKINADIPVYQVKAGVGYARGLNDWDVIETIKAGETVEVASKKSTTWISESCAMDNSFDGMRLL